MEPLTTSLIATALANGLLYISQKLIDDGLLAPPLEPLIQRLQTLVKRSNRASERALQAAVERALATSGAPLTEEGDAVQQWLKGKSLDRLVASGNDALRHHFARSLVAFTNADAAPPADLLVALAWPRSQQPQLAQLLTALRGELYALEEWRPLIDYANALEQQGLLKAALLRLARLDHVFIESAAGAALRVVVVQSGLSAAEAIAIEESYRADLVRDLRLHDFHGIGQLRKDIRLPLADIYLELGLLNLGNESERQAAHERILAMRQTERLAEEERRLADRVTDALSAAQRLVILGEPGAGKTISLKFIQLILAYGYGAARLGLRAPYIPLLVRVADFARALETTPALALDNFLLRVVEEQFPQPRLGDFMRLALEKGACLVLLDGLDEVGDDPIHGQSLRSRVVQRVQQFGDRWCDATRPNRLIITSRIEGYWDAALRGCRHVQLSPLRPPDEIEEFLLRWYTAHEQAHDPHLPNAVADQRARRQVEGLLRDIMGSASVRRLATNPLLLTILALIHENVGKLPNRRIKLYEAAAHTLIESWRRVQTGLSSKLLAEFGEEKVIQVMAPLAYWLHKERPGGTATFGEWRQQLCQILADVGYEEQAQEIADRFLHHARYEAGLLAERGLGQFGFFHLTFEEYLAAREIARRRTDERRALLQAHWEDPRWQEVLLLVAGQLGIAESKTDDVGDLLVDLLEMEPANPENDGRQVVLAGRALADIGAKSVKPPTRRLVFDMLRETMQDLHPDSKRPNDPPQIGVRTRYAAGEVLDELGWLPDDLHTWVRCAGCADDGGDLLAMRYPVTNAHFARFVESDGYTNPLYWGGEASVGWQWRMEGHNPDWRGKEPVDKPEDWYDARYGQERHGYPVVGVSWYEADAFARWLTMLLARVRTGEATVTDFDRALVADLLQAGATHVRLPSSGEWSRLAGSEADKARYPWDSPAGPVTADPAEILARANTAESDMGGTSPVALYLQGRSQPFGLAELAGNVWEWTDSWYDREQSGRVLRGGSWGNPQADARCTVRNLFSPGRSYLNIGLRLVSPIDSGS